MRVSQRVQQIQPSATLTINAKATEMRNKGQDVVSLAAGEPDFLPPEHVMERARQAIDWNMVRYTPVPGTNELRDAAAEYFSRFYQVDPGRERILITNGGKHALYNLFQALLDPGDQVIVPAPYWVSYPEMIRLSDAIPVCPGTDPEMSFLLDGQTLRENCGPRTRALILNTPSNPTGCHYTQNQLDKLIETALKQGLFVISDEVYDQLVFPPAQTSSAAKWADSHPESVAVVNALSKSFSLTGWRVGFVLAHEELVEGMNKIQSQSTSNVCNVAQEAAVAALRGSFQFLKEQREILARRRDLAMDYINSWPGVQCPTPDGAFYIFPRVDGYFHKKIPDSTAMCSHLLEEAGVALVPGAAFGDDRCIRISYAVHEDKLSQALQKLGASLSRI